MANRGCWGTASEGVFTADSSPCRAARCAGVISDGGVYTLSSCDGRPSYEGGTKNGITISGWGDYPLSFTVMGTSSFSRPEPEKPKHLDCDKYVKDTCSGVYLCAGGTCPMAGRAVWGGIDNGGKFFTGDSSPCAAARAEGVISGGGGVFRLVACGDRPTMGGFSSNGIEVRPCRPCRR
jgi:hypothetical protein